MSDMRPVTDSDLERVDKDALEEILSEYIPLAHGNSDTYITAMLRRYIAARCMVISSDGGDEWYVCASNGRWDKKITVHTRSEAYQTALEILINRETT